MPGAGGRMWLCGKHHIGPDPQAVLTATGATTVVCLTQRHELEDRFPEYVAWLDGERDRRVIWLPIDDLSVPSLPEFARLVDDVAQRLGARRARGGALRRRDRSGGHGRRPVCWCARGWRPRRRWRTSPPTAPWRVPRSGRRPS